jgi:hypothetical protein
MLTEPRLKESAEKQRERDKPRPRSSIGPEKTGEASGDPLQGGERSRESWEPLPENINEIPGIVDKIYLEDNETIMNK